MSHSLIARRPLHHSLYRVAELRAIESAAQRALPPGALMQRAGAAAADLAIAIGNQLPGAVWVLAGPGNNGGDALVVARLLAAQGLPVQVAVLDDPEAYSGEARAAWLDWNRPVRRDLNGIAGAALIVDGLFGIGLNRPMPQTAIDWLARVNHLAAQGTPVLALDIPSGIEADTGRMPGGTAIQASHTITFIGDKPGLHTLDGPDHAGIITLATLQLDLPSASGRLSQPGDFAAALRPRRRNSHKGSYGHLGVVGGNTGMVGAGLLAARSALHAGAGRVSLHLLGRDAPAFDGMQPELMLRDSLSKLDLNAVCAGPGMGQDAHAAELLAELLQRPIGLLLDADALNIIATSDKLAALLTARSNEVANLATVLTPHPLEAARLMASTLAEVQRNRVETALELARRFKACIVLKGVGSVIAAPNGDWAINPTGNPALASAGTGDVLAGLTGALLAQGWSAWQAALAGAWLHGTAADDLVRDGAGPLGLSAGELILPIRKALNRLIQAANIALET